MTLNPAFKADRCLNQNDERFKNENNLVTEKHLAAMPGLN
jgi:hypothetical protein